LGGFSFISATAEAFGAYLPKALNITLNWELSTGSGGERRSNSVASPASSYIRLRVNPRFRTWSSYPWYVEEK
jgi:hypothetical protein